MMSNRGGVTSGGTISYRPLITRGVVMLRGVMTTLGRGGAMTLRVTSVLGRGEEIMLRSRATTTPGSGAITLRVMTMLGR